MALLETLFWSSALGLGYTYLGYPVLVGLAARFAPRPWRTAPITPA